MKIVDIRTTALSYRCDPPYGSAAGMQARRGALIVEIETDERITGIGEAAVDFRSRVQWQLLFFNAFPD